MNEIFPVPIGDWRDLTESDVFEEGGFSSEEAQDEDKERRRKERERNEHKNEDGGNRTGANETFGGSENNYSKEQTQKVYKQHNALDDFALAESYRIRDALVEKSGVNQTDVIRSARTVMKIADASGVEAAVRYSNLSKAMAKMQDVTTAEGRNVADACVTLLQKGYRPENGFSLDVKGLNDFRKVVDKALLDETGIDISRMSDAELKELIRSNKLSSAKSKLEVMRQGGDAQSLAETSLLVRNHIGKANAFKKAKAKRNSAAENLVNRLMGDDVALWEGSQYALRTYRSIKRIAKTIKKIKNALLKNAQASQAKAACAAEAVVQEQPIVTRPAVLGEKKPLLDQPKNLLRDGNKVKQKVRRRSCLIEKYSKIAARKGAAVSGSAAAGTAAGGGAAAGGAASGAAAGGSAASGATASAGAGAGAAAGGVAFIVIIVVLLIVVVLVAAGSVLSSSHGDVDNSLEEAKDAELKDSMLYKVYTELSDLDNQYLNNINRDDYSKSDVLDLAINSDIYYARNPDEYYYNPITGAHGITIDALVDANNDVVYKSYNGLGEVIPLGRSNAKDILSAATVLVENDAETKPNTFKRYAKELWFDTHDLSVELLTNDNGSLLVEPCEDGCSATYWIESERVRNGTYEDGTPKYKHVNYFYGDDGTRIKYSSVWLQISELVREKHLFMFYDIESDTFKFCNGHAKYRTVSTVFYMDDNTEDRLQSSLFTADKFTTDPQNADFWNGRGEFGRWYKFLNVYQAQFTDFYKNPVEWTGESVKTFEAWFGKKAADAVGGAVEGAFNWVIKKATDVDLDEIDDDETAAKSEEYIEWEGWTDDNKDWAFGLFDEDWYDLYGISFATGGSGIEMDASEINKLVENVDSETMQNLLKFALGNVGKIPYYWGGKQNVSEKYIDHADMTPSEFLAKYYPHLGTQQVEIKNGAVQGVNGWYGCGGVDSKRSTIGLDCSGWVCFIYNNMGIRLSGGTGDLKTAGKRVNFDELKPGDLMIDDPNNAHVVMFLCWDDEKHTRYSTIESAGSSGVIKRSGITKSWEYYRRIVD